MRRRSSLLGYPDASGQGSRSVVVAPSLDVARQDPRDDVAAAFRTQQAAVQLGSIGGTEVVREAIPFTTARLEPGPSRPLGAGRAQAAGHAERRRVHRAPGVPVRRPRRPGADADSRHPPVGHDRPASSPASPRGHRARSPRASGRGPGRPRSRRGRGPGPGVRADAAPASAAGGGPPRVRLDGLARAAHAAGVTRRDARAARRRPRERPPRPRRRSLAARASPEPIAPAVAAGGRSARPQPARRPGAAALGARRARRAQPGGDGRV